MTNEQAREIFNQAAIGKTGDELANLEIAREYFCNPGFRKFLEEQTYLLNTEQQT